MEPKHEKPAESKPPKKLIEKITPSEPVVEHEISRRFRGGNMDYVIIGMMFVFICGCFGYAKLR